VSNLHAGTVADPPADAVPDYAGALETLKRAREKAAEYLIREQAELDHCLKMADGNKDRIAKATTDIRSIDVAIAKLEAEGTP
jgi:hypothetical protein